MSPQASVSLLQQDGGEYGGLGLRLGGDVHLDARNGDSLLDR